MNRPALEPNAPAPPDPQRPHPAVSASWPDRYWALFRSAWMVDLQYRPTIAIWLILGLAQPLVMLAIWWSVAGEGGVAGYGQADFARYFFALMLVDQLTLA